VEQNQWYRATLLQTDPQTDGHATCRSNTALCVASRGNHIISYCHYIYS